MSGFRLWQLFNLAKAIDISLGKDAEENLAILLGQTMELDADNEEQYE